MIRWFALLLIVLLFAPLVASQPSVAVASEVADTTFHPTPTPSLSVPRRTAPISIDGDLNDEGWKTAAHVDEFTSALPVANSRPPQRTEAFITYDSNYLYIAMIAHDDHPERIRSSMAGRDKIWDDDFMGILLDTYGDATRVFEIYANPRGVQGDLFWTATNEDDTYDMVYTAESRITVNGWQTEMRIPFSSLRFPERVKQDFHISFWRNYPREVDYKISWAPINFFIPCPFCQFGSLTGIESIRPSGSLELLPALVATQDATVDQSKGNDGPFVNGPVTVHPSLGLRYALGPATGLEAAIKPDFSQVEADQAQVSANNTFALFYPERRPFFQDGGDLYNTNLAAIYTRSINSPLVAAKAIHRDDVNSLLYLGGIDDHSPTLIPLEERTIVLPDRGRSYSNIVRATHTFGDDAFLGLLATDRRDATQGSNTVVGLDGRLNPFENIEIIAQELVSSTREPNTHELGTTALFDRGLHTIEYDGEQYLGDAGYFMVQRMTQTVDVQTSLVEYSPTFRADNGFITGNDSRVLTAWIGDKDPLQQPPPLFRWVQEVDGTITLQENLNYANEVKRRAYRVELDFAFMAQTNMHVFYRGFLERFNGITFTGLHQWDLRWDSKPAQAFAFGGEYTGGKIIARLVDPPEVGNETDVTIWLRIKPLDGLVIEPTWTFSQLDRFSGGEYYSGSIYFSRFTYQFNRDLSARAIVQYDNFARRFDIDPLVTYKLNPFTSFYIGSTHTYTAFDPQSPILASDRQFFAKIQYLFQT